MALTWPNNSKSGAIINSIVFIVAMMSICANALIRDLSPDNIHTAMNVSRMPIAFVKKTSCSLPNILATIN